MKELLALKIGDYRVNSPPGIPTGDYDHGQVLIRNGISIFLAFLIIIALFYVVWAGISWITSQGDKTKLQSARNRLIYAIVGLIVAFFSFFIVGFLGNFLGVQYFGGGTTTPPVSQVGQGDPCAGEGGGCHIPTPTTAIYHPPNR